ncbi:MAG: RAD55 family ATPase [Thermoplasmata archaeon]
MFRKSVPGLDRVFHTEIEPPKVILVTGPAGALKSTFCYAAMSRYLKETGEFGLYTTLEETVTSHLKNMESLGVDISLNMQISDFTDLREIDKVMAEGDQADYLQFLEKMIAHYRKVHGKKFVLFSLDSLGALYSLMADTDHMRKRMFYFFRLLREQNLLSLIIMERAIGGESQLLGNEGFLVDGIITLGLDRIKGKLVRYLQVEKMRAVRHSVEKHLLEAGDNGIAILGPLLETAQM